MDVFLVRDIAERTIQRYHKEFPERLQVFSQLSVEYLVTFMLEEEEFSTKCDLITDYGNLEKDSTQIKENLISQAVDSLLRVLTQPGNQGFGQNGKYSTAIVSLLTLQTDYAAIVSSVASERTLDRDTNTPFNSFFDSFSRQRGGLGNGEGRVFFFMKDLIGFCRSSLRTSHDLMSPVEQQILRDIVVKTDFENRLQLCQSQGEAYWLLKQVSEGVMREFLHQSKWELPNHLRDVPIVRDIQRLSIFNHKILELLIDYDSYRPSRSMQDIILLFAQYDRYLENLSSLAEQSLDVLNRIAKIFEGASQRVPNVDTSDLLQLMVLHFREVRFLEGLHMLHTFLSLKHRTVLIMKHKTITIWGHSITIPEEPRTQRLFKPRGVLAELTSGLHPNFEMAPPRVLSYEQIAGSQVSFQCRGFCPIALLEHPHRLIYGNRTYGILQISDFNYICSSPEAFEEMKTNGTAIHASIHMLLEKANFSVPGIANLFTDSSCDLRRLISDKQAHQNDLDTTDQSVNECNT